METQLQNLIWIKMKILKHKNILIICFLLVTLSYSSINLGIDPLKFFNGIPNLIIIANEITIMDHTLLVIAFKSMFETIQMAFVGTIFGSILAFPLSILASRNLTNRWIYCLIRSILAVVRTFPSILWAILFVILVGLGPFAGVLAIILYTIGFITKLQYESIEAVDAESIQNIASLGISKLQLIRYVIIPESAPHLLSQLLYTFDYNVRHTSIIGLVGAGGIGFYIINYIKFFEYGKAAVFMLVVLLSVIMIDLLSVNIRDRYITKFKKPVKI